MSLIQTPWTSQPQQAVGIDWSNPITRGLQYAYIPASIGTSGLSKKVFGGAVGVNASSATSGGAVLEQLDTGTTGTIFIVGLHPPAGSSGQYFYDGETATNRDLLYRKDANSTTYGWFVGGHEVANTTPLPEFLFDVDKPTSVALVWRSGAQTAYKNGSVFATRSVTITASSKRSIRLASRYTSTEGLTTGAIFLLAKFSRELSQAEVNSLSKNPWQIFKPLPRRIFVPVAAGGGTTAVTSDHNASYTITGSVAADASASYNLRTSATQDASAAYGVAGSVSQATSASYNLRTSAAQDASASYNLRTAVTQDTSASYQIVSAGQVVASFAPTYNIRTTTQVDLAPGYAVRDTLSSDINVGYTVAQAVQQEISAAYSLRTSAQQSLTGTYNVLVISTVTSNLVASYLVASELINRERLTFNGNIHRTAPALSPI